MFVVYDWPFPHVYFAKNVANIFSLVIVGSVFSDVFCGDYGTRKFDRGLGQILHDQLHWLDVPDRVLFKLAVTVHQCLNGRAPPYLTEHCIPVSSADTRRHLRSANRHLLAVPRFPLNTYGRRTFSVAGPMAWNSLPDFIRYPSSSTDCFRRLYLKCTCSRVSSASSALGVLND